MSKQRKKSQKKTIREVLKTLDALRAEVAELKENHQILGRSFGTLENRYNALETNLSHMQATKLGHGPSVNGSQVKS
jgi:FtsZ-binding cell division protein ZapB